MLLIKFLCIETSTPPTRKFSSVHTAFFMGRLWWQNYFQPRMQAQNPLFNRILGILSCILWKILNKPDLWHDVCYVVWCVWTICIEYSSLEIRIEFEAKSKSWIWVWTIENEEDIRWSVEYSIQFPFFARLESIIAFFQMAFIPLKLELFSNFLGQ